MTNFDTSKGMHNYNMSKFSIFKGSSENMYNNYPNCPLSKIICVKRSLYKFIFVNIGKFRRTKNTTQIISFNTSK